MENLGGWRQCTRAVPAVLDATDVGDESIVEVGSRSVLYDELISGSKISGNRRELGAHLHTRLRTLTEAGLIARSRGVGLWAGIDVEPERMTGRELCERLLKHGVLAKDTHGSTIRLAPPLVMERADLDLALDRLAVALV